MPSGVVFWRVTALDGMGATVGTSATWEFVAPRRDAPIDTAWGVLKDFNGDGYADIAVGNSAYGSEGSGKAYAYAGSGSGPAPTPAWTYTGLAMTSSLGQSIAGCGDINGDGLGDLVVGAPFSGSGADYGWSYLFLGQSGLFAADPSEVFMATPPLPGNGLGFSVAGAGDVNGDGLGDVILGAPGGGEDSAYVGYGSPSGSVTLERVDGSMYAIPSDFDYPAFGSSVAQAGDLDGDGYGDVVVGGDHYRHGVGLAVIYFGSAAGIDLTSGIQINPTPDAANFFGTAVMGIGDVNGDHLGDFAIGSEGSVTIFYGRADRHFETPDLVLTSTDPGAGTPGREFGANIASPGDYNGDGFADLVVGEPAAGPSMPGEPRVGLVNIYLGAASGLSTVPSYVLQAPAGYYQFGFGVACVGDVDGDGYDDLAVGATTLDGSSTGSFSWFRGSSTGLPTSPSILRMNSDSGEFGLSLCRTEPSHACDVLLRRNSGSDVRPHICAGSSIEANRG